MDVTASLNEVGLFDLTPKAFGRPKVISLKVKEQIVFMLAHGLTEDKIAEILRINRSTIWLAKKDRDFSNAVLMSKNAADQEVVKALYLSATGYSHPHEKVFCHDGQIITHETTRHYPPNPGSITLWLINRQRDNWRKEIQHEENRPDQRAPMIRVMERVSGKEAAQIKATGDAVTVLLGADFVSRIQSQQKQVETNGHNGTGH